MEQNKLKKIWLILSILIIIISFVYAINIQPMVIGIHLNILSGADSNLTIFLKQFQIL